MELENNLANTLNVENRMNIGKEQNSFLESTMGKIINVGLNTGIRALLPNLIEGQVIDIKDAILKNGFQAGVKQAIQSASELGKSALGIVTGKFDNINQAHTAIKNGGMIDSISNVLDFAINKAMQFDLIPTSIGQIIKKGKNVIMSTIDSNIENNFNNQLSALEKLGKYSNNWKGYYKEKDFDGMEKEYEKIKETLPTILPIENTIKEVRKIENLHLIIKNKGKNFNMSEEELALAEKLVG